MTKAEEPSLERFLDFMSRNGLNTTAQRRTIAEIFFNTPGHHTLEEFYARIHKEDASIGQTTVYRTLKLLCDAGMAIETHFRDGVARYEIAHPNNHHDHMVCLKCGQITEIIDERIEALQLDLAKKYKFKLTGHVHNLYGFCENCQKEVALEWAREE